jgi:hypothetical protein
VKPTAADTSKMPKKKPYTRPSLTCHGKFKDLVQGAGGNKSDGGGVPRSRACWVAEVLYGIDDPRTHLLRAWLPRAAAQRVGWHLFLAIYTAVGQQAAALIERSRILRACATPLFDGLVATASRDATTIVRTAVSLQPTT